MKNKHLIIALTVLLFASCKNKETDDSSMSMDTIQEMETTVDTTTMMMDSTMVDSSGTMTNGTESSDVKLPNKLDETKKIIKVDNTKGKYTLSETKWRLIEVNGKSVKSSEAKDYFINLDSKTGRFTGFVGCNTVMGSYAMIDATKLQFSKVGSTKMSCPDGNVESKFMKMIEKVENYKIEGSNLYFNKSNSSDVLKFEAVM